LTFDQFCEKLAEGLEMPREAFRPETSFIEELAFDSLRLLLLAALFEDLDVEMPAELAWDIRTVGDASAYYSKHAQAASLTEVG
jgi:acyl carrier protein